jgi:hypothetical protein
MENGKILDSQITASSSLTSTRASDARFRHSGAWCPQKADKVNQSLQNLITHHLGETLRDCKQAIQLSQVT